MTHFIRKCTCGKILGQCRCMSKDKTIEIVENGCEECSKLPKGWHRYYRDDRDIWEDICPHGIGHSDGVHGCDGCCQKLKEDK